VNFIHSLTIFTRGWGHPRSTVDGEPKSTVYARCVHGVTCRLVSSRLVASRQTRSLNYICVTFRGHCVVMWRAVLSATQHRTHMNLPHTASNNWTMLTHNS